MSYDFRIVSEDRPPCECCGRPRGKYSDWFADPTYNLGAIFRKASDGRFKQGQPMTLGDARIMFSDMIVTLAAVVRWDHREAKAYHDLLPTNGWGTMEGALRVCRLALDKITAIGDTVEINKWAPLADDYSDAERETISADTLRFIA